MKYKILGLERHTYEPELNRLHYQKEGSDKIYNLKVPQVISIEKAEQILKKEKI